MDTSNIMQCLATTTTGVRCSKGASHAAVADVAFCTQHAKLFIDSPDPTLFKVCFKGHHKALGTIYKPEEVSKLRFALMKMIADMPSSSSVAENESEAMDSGDIEYEHKHEDTAERMMSHRRHDVEIAALLEKLVVTDRQSRLERETFDRELKRATMEDMIDDEKARSIHADILNKSIDDVVAQYKSSHLAVARILTERRI